MPPFDPSRRTSIARSGRNDSGRTCRARPTVDPYKCNIAEAWIRLSLDITYSQLSGEFERSHAPRCPFAFAIPPPSRASRGRTPSAPRCSCNERPFVCRRELDRCGFLCKSSAADAPGEPVYRRHVRHGRRTHHVRDGAGREPGRIVDRTTHSNDVRTGQRSHESGMRLKYAAMAVDRYFSSGSRSK